ncbi:probable FeS assembly SUF system protein SufT [Fontimonas thermophila]|uniref:Probable FeS assembly SUF system protein SufT n=1 Tax=Fontimonas thermophila TaxID=1076937 RepID=A0A1I2H5Z1_9GAMM|nr:putative Fe-S cluster assembly protein SufT [Fontimonas thermophila]SFF25092.1 probable FeS assembly SUF system protein SufT [Fontimonas thermophila]
MSALYEPVTLRRDVIGILIPQGTKVELPEGASGAITQALGGSFTVQVEGHLFRIDGKDADALGKEPVKGPEVPPDASDEELEKAVWAQLHTCYDPEIPVDIVELGLVYECKIEPLGEGQRRAKVRMTLTAPGCGMGDILVGDVKSKILALPTIAEADVELVFDPPWNPSMMSDAAKLATGMF